MANSNPPPIVIPCINNPTYVTGMLAQLQERKLSNVILIDNNSTYPEMLDLLHAVRNDVRVIRLRRNYGPRYFSKNWWFYHLGLPRIFCVTDPDIQFNSAMPSDFIEILTEATKEFKVGKAGLALDISDTGSMRSDQVAHGGKKYKIWEWEAQFWQHQISKTSGGDPIYRAPIDTTFAVYNKAIYIRRDGFSLRAVRIAGRFTARHLPWYRDNGLPMKEEEFYRATAQSHSWYFGAKSRSEE
jgi:glycosyltransferase involved in cell wall biosynthesis